MRDLKALAEQLLDETAAVTGARKMSQPLMMVCIAGREPKTGTVRPGFLASQRGKDALFGTMRKICQTNSIAWLPPELAQAWGLADPPCVEAFGFSAEAWQGSLTEKGKRLAAENPEEWRKLLGPRMDTLLREGYIARREAVVATVQDSERVVVATRPFARSGGRFNWLEEARFMETSQADIGGRVKMWGDPA